MSENLSENRLELETKTFPDAEKAVIDALEKVDVKWRTFDKILEETQLSPATVKNVFSELQKDSNLAKTISPFTNQEVYTTLNHYKKTHDFWDMSLSALTGSYRY